MDARERAEAIRYGIDATATALAEVPDMVMLAYEAEDWKELDYDTWQDYVQGEFGTSLLRLTKAMRRVWTTQLKKAGLSTREIAPVVNVDQSTVVRDLAAPKAIRGDADASPDIVDAEIVEEEAEPEGCPVIPWESVIKDQRVILGRYAEDVPPDEAINFAAMLRKVTVKFDRKAHAGSQPAAIQVPANGEPTSKQINEWQKSLGRKVNPGRVSEAVKAEYLAAHAKD